MEYFFKTNMPERLLDFVLGAKSPMLKAGEPRVAMGGSYAQPNLSSIMKIITTMIGATNLLTKYPLTAMTNKMMQNKEMLGKILEENSANKDFGAQLTGMCKDNYEMTKISQLVSKSKFRSNNKYEYGLELVERINDDAYTYVSTLMTTTTEDALMTLLLKQRGRMDTFCIKALKDLISLCLKDIEIARYIYRQAPPSY